MLWWPCDSVAMLFSSTRRLFSSVPRPTLVLGESCANLPSSASRSTSFEVRLKNDESNETDRYQPSRWRAEAALSAEKRATDTDASVRGARERSESKEAVGWTELSAHVVQSRAIKFQRCSDVDTVVAPRRSPRAASRERSGPERRRGRIAQKPIPNCSSLHFILKSPWRNRRACCVPRRFQHDRIGSRRSSRILRVHICREAEPTRPSVVRSLDLDHACRLSRSIERCQKSISMF